MPVHYAPRIHELTKALALAMKAVYACDGASTRQHNEPAGNPNVWRYHLHVTPRHAGDGFYASQRTLMSADERAKHAQKLRAQLAGWKPTT